MRVDTKGAAEPVASNLAEDPAHTLESACTAGTNRNIKIGINITTSFDELIKNPDQYCLKYAPVSAALSGIFGHEAFNDLQGGTKQAGDIAHCVQDQVKCDSVQSTFPVPLGVKIHAVENSVVSSMDGKPYAFVVPANSSLPNIGTLCKADVATARKFVNEFPNYTGSNLQTFGVHPVTDRGFLLVSSKHPILQAIHDNQGEYKNAACQPYSDGLYKIGMPLWEAVLPVIEKQISSQLTVTNYSKWQMSLHPMGQSWKQKFDAHLECKQAGIKAKYGALINAAEGDAKQELKRQLDSELAHTRAFELNNPLTLSCNVGVDYFFLSSNVGNV